MQVSDTKTRQEELSGQKASGNNSSINLTIDDDKNKGYFGKIMGGYGSGERYESSALLNYFKGERKISVLASSNNINSTGFSMDEIFDSMGGGRNVLLGSQAATNSQGITQSTVAGANYNDELVKGFDSSVSYFYNTADTQNTNRTRETTFIPDANGQTGDKSIITDSKSVTDNNRFTHNVNTEFEIKPDDASRLSFKPKFVSGNSQSRTQTSQATSNQDGRLSNESDATTFSDADNTSFSSSLYYNKAFKSNKRRSVGISFNNENTLNDAANYNKSNTVFYDTIDGSISRADIRDQVRYNRQSQDSYSGGLEYFEPITDSLRLKISANYSAQQNAQNRLAFDHDDATGDYTIANDTLSNYLRTQTNTLSPRVGIDYDYRKFNFQADLGQTITKFDTYSLYLGDKYSLTKNYILPAANASVRYQFAKSTSLYSNYNYSISMPSANQVLPVTDLSNPLFTYVGNPDLDPNKTHNLSINFRDFDFASRSGYNIFSNGSYRDSQVVSYTEIDESAKRTTTYKNVSGAYTTSLGGNYNKTLKTEAHTFRLGVGANTDYSLTKGFTNGQLYEARALGIRPWINLNYDYGELLTIAPSYSYTYRQTNYANIGTKEASNYVHRVGLQTTNYWPKNIVFGNDFSYTYNSNIAAGFKKDFYLWNMSLGYNFLNDHFLARVKVYDLLNQNVGTSRSIGATSITDQENTVLKRYVMFSLTYSLKQFGPRKKEGERGGGRSQGRRGGA